MIDILSYIKTKKKGDDSYPQSRIYESVLAMRNMKIGTRITTTFVIIMLLFLIATTVAIVNVRGVAENLTTFYKQPFAVVTIVRDMRYELVSAQRYIYRAVTEIDPTLKDKYLNEAQNSLTSLQELCNTVKEKFSGEQQLVTNFNNKMVESIPIKEQIMTNIRNVKHTEALEIMNKQYLPMMEEAFAMLDTITKSSNDKATFFVEGGKKIERDSIVTLVILALVSFIFLTVICIYITKSLTNPISKLKTSILEISKGNLKTQVDYTSKDELGELATSIKTITTNLNMYISNMDETLNKLSKKDLTASVDIEYLGDFAPMKISMMTIAQSWNDMTNKIKEASERVSSGAEQIADASQALAIGATDQSSSVEELVATVHEVNEHVSLNAKNAENVNTLSSNSSKEVNKGNEYMKKLLSAMEKINTQSQVISNIIKVIDDISSQTNLLSLNASIEAARAGEQGSGFAVVANEIGKLANESSQAAKDTAELINNSITAVMEASNLADETAEVLINIVTSSSETSKLVSQISEACNQQAVSLNEILKGVQQISVVVETNSATAEQTSASSEEMLSQAELLTGILNEFKTN